MAEIPSGQASQSFLRSQRQQSRLGTAVLMLVRHELGLTVA